MRPQTEEREVLVFSCPNCQLEWLEPFCDSCGKSLAPRRHLEPVPEQTSPYLMLLNDIARDDWSRRV